MADVFISYARADKARVAPLVKAIEAKGWSVWWDLEISPGTEFDGGIDEELQAALGVLAAWTPTSVAARRVRGKARDAAERGVLVTARFEGPLVAGERLPSLRFRSLGGALASA